MNKQHYIPGKAPQEKVEQMTFELPTPQPIKGFPELRWAGKRPFTSTHYFPAQLKERYGDPVDGWMNRIYWGDNLQVMDALVKAVSEHNELLYDKVIPLLFDTLYEVTSYKKEEKKEVELVREPEAGYYSIHEGAPFCFWRQ